MNYSGYSSSSGLVNANSGACAGFRRIAGLWSTFIEAIAWLLFSSSTFEIFLILQGDSSLGRMLPRGLTPITYLQLLFDMDSLDFSSCFLSCFVTTELTSDVSDFLSMAYLIGFMTFSL